MNIPDSRCVLPALSSVNGKCIYIVFYSLPTYTHIHTDGSKLHCYLWFLCLAQEQFHMWAAAGDCTTIPAFSGWSAEPQPFTRGLRYNDHTREIIDLLYFHNTSRHVKSLNYKCSCTFTWFKCDQSGLNRLFKDLCQMLLQWCSKGLCRCHLLGVQVDPRGVRLKLCSLWQVKWSLWGTSERKHLLMGCNFSFQFFFGLIKPTVQTQRHLIRSFREKHKF